MNNNESNLERYHRLSQPFASLEKAEKAIQGFHGKVGELRDEFVLRDVLIMVSVSCLDGDEEVSECAFSHYGDSGKREAMLLSGLLQLKKERDAILKVALEKEDRSQETAC